MKKSIMLVLLENRRESSAEVQKALTEMGCFIKTRIGLNDSTPEHCTNAGLIILELMGDHKAKNDLYDRLKVIPQVSVQLVELSI
jgi:hypothetical protein